MPNYEFKCLKKSCGHRHMQLMSHAEWLKLQGKPPKCPKCGGKTEAMFPNPFGVVR